MEFDWSVELGADDPVLEFPWSSPDGTRRYVDLLHRPETLADIPEAVKYPELGAFLRKVNLESPAWLTVKCDVWLDCDLDEAETIYDAAVKFCSYVDLLARDTAARSSFEWHESWVKSAARQLDSAVGEPIAGELIVRRCWYRSPTGREHSHRRSEVAGKDPVAGFYVTVYLFGYGRDESAARANWAEGLRQVTSVIAAIAT
jgi:hypothetical protein